MTKEQAIERMYDLINTCNEGIEKHGAYDDLFQKDKEAIETVLSMLKEKDREINSKNGTINALQCALKERTEERDRKDDLYNKALSDLVNAENKNIKQDKIIDLMAEQVAGLTIWNNEKEEPLILPDIADVKQYFENKVNSSEQN